jgi:cell division inhibitor SulA/protein ImuA
MVAIAAPEVSSSDSDHPSGLEALLRHPAIWRGRSAAQVDIVSSGYSRLDQALPGGGWPRTGLIEILVEHLGSGELYLLLPALASLTRKHAARWCAWIAPPFEPFAPALAAHGVALEKIFVARTQSPLWAFEQSLVSGACEAALAWVPRAPVRDIRRLQLAAEKGRSLGVLFRPKTAARESSAAVLRLTVEPTEQGVRIALLKSRGGSRDSIALEWNGSERAQQQAHGCAGEPGSQEGFMRSAGLRPDSSDPHAGPGPHNKDG